MENINWKAMETVIVSINGMTCNSCVQTIEKQLLSESGVKTIKVIKNYTIYLILF